MSQVLLINVLLLLECQSPALTLGVLLNQVLNCEVLLVGALTCIVLAAHKSWHLASVTVSHNLRIVAICLAVTDRLHVLIEVD